MTRRAYRSVRERRAQRRELVVAPQERRQIDRGAACTQSTGLEVSAVGVASPLHLRERNLGIGGRPLLCHLRRARKVALVEHALEIVGSLIVVFVHRR